MLLAGNHKDALKTVFGLFSIAGMEPVVTGALQPSRRAEPQYLDAL
jgi:predicted dinucleotide-binding enzyme